MNEERREAAYGRSSLLYGPLVSGAAPDTTFITVDAAAKRAESSGVSMEIVFKGVSAEGIVFDVAFDNMDAPPLRTDLLKLATLAVDTGAPMTPSSWTVRQIGHMGHRLRGQLVFPAGADGRPVLGPGAKSFELRLAGSQGKRQALFSWRIPAR